MQNKITEINLENIDTEKSNKLSENIDTLSTLEIIEVINNEDKKVAKQVELELKNIAKLIDLIVNSFNNNGRLIYIGAGTSGRLGVLDASECPPTYGVSNDLVIGIIAGGAKALQISGEEVEDNAEQAIKDLKNINLNSKDTLVGIAASGRTPYVLSALKYANSINANTGAISCSKNSKASEIADVSIEVDTGAEVISGSTRMKAGTAQKLVLNMLTTTAMIKIGKVYKNYMVDVKTNNLKLIERAKNIVCEITGCDYQTSTKLLEQSNNQVKPAILMFLNNIDYKTAKNILKSNNGFLRNSINIE